MTKQRLLASPSLLRELKPLKFHCHVCRQGLMNMVHCTEPINSDQPKWANNQQCWAASRRVDVHMLKTGFNPDIYRGNRLIDMFAKCGSLVDARYVFDKMSVKNVFSWNMMLGAYAKCGNMEHARQLFDKMTERNTVSWTAMIGGFAQIGHVEEALKLFCQMRREGIEPDRVTFTSALCACSFLESSDLGKQVHAYIVKTGYESNMLLSNTIIDTYGKCGEIDDARNVFDKMPERDGVSFNAMIAGYARHGRSDEALELYSQMRLEGRKPTQFTFSAVCSAYANLQTLAEGRPVHAFIIQTGFQSNVFVGNALVDMYAKCGCIDVARKLFDEMPERDGISWNAMIAAYVWHGQGEESLSLFQQLQWAGLEPADFPFASALSACVILLALEKGKQIHSQIIKTGVDSNVNVGNALVDMYAKCGGIVDARQMFDKRSNRNRISWTAIITGYSHQGLGDEALELFSQMQRVEVNPDQATFASVLRACASLAALEQGKQIHAYVIKIGYETNVFAGSALLDMYAKCGCIDDACQVFNEMPERNLVSWNAMIAACAQNGYGKEATQLFEQMLQAGMSPDYVSFISVLTACSHAGLVDEGRHYFNCMGRDYGILPREEHYACMIDLLGRAGYLDDAEDVINNMPFEPNATMWLSLLGACRVQGNMDIGRRAAKCLFELEPQNAAPYVLMSNIYAAAGMWDDVAKVKKLMKDRGVKKEPGYSWIEVNNRTHAFTTDDRSHTQTEEIYATLQRLVGQMKKAGYVPDVNFELHDVEEEHKEHSCCCSEKLAVTFGFISTPSGTPI